MTVEINLHSLYRIRRGEVVCRPHTSMLRIILDAAAQASLLTTLRMDFYKNESFFASFGTGGESIQST